MAHNGDNQPICSQKIPGTVVLRYNAYTKKDLFESVQLTSMCVTRLSAFLNERTRNNKSFQQVNKNNINNWVSVLNRHYDACENNCTTTHSSIAGQQACFKLALAFADLGLECRHQTLVQPVSRTTVIRSPFVFKKTREQFGLQKRVITVSLRLTSIEQAFVSLVFSQLRLPAEVKLTCYN